MKFSKVSPPEKIVDCGLLARKRKCNQVKCPVDCKQSRWSSWSKCTKNGGMACNTAVESQPCNTGSCDRNCRLRKWTSWSPCSVACAGGFSERWRRVIIPIRGNGKCPKPKSRIRYGLKKCNTHPCIGDEVCIAKQDLILSVDSSGSLRDAGFKI